MAQQEETFAAAIAAFMANMPKLPVLGRIHTPFYLH